MSNYVHKIEWNDKASINEKLKATYNLLNWLLHEMSIGRVKNNKEELSKNIDTAKEELSLPLSITFVKMVEKGEIDEVTASENAGLFLEWNEKSSFNVNELRQREGNLYKCLQAHTGQVGWEPENTPALWKLIGVNENGIPYWSRPISSADSYMIGDECIYNGFHKRSAIDYNVWSPDEYPEGWEDVILENIEIPGSGDN